MHGRVNLRLDKLRIGVTVPSLNVGDCTMKNFGDHGLLDKAGQVALFSTLTPKQRAKGQVSLGRNLDAPTDWGVLK